MGALVALPDGAITPTVEPGVHVERDVSRAQPLVRKLGPNPSCPLYPLSVGAVSWPREGGAKVELSPAVYVVESFATGRRLTNPTQQRYLEVAPGTARWVSEAEAMVLLGAIDELRSLGLEDAAVALSAGELDAARVQWLRWRDGLA